MTVLGHGESMIDFEKNSYTVVKGLIEPEWCKTLYNYVGYSADRCGLKQKHDEEKYREAWDGTFQDKQCPGNYAHYGDPMMDSMMMAHGKKIEEVTGMTLAPSYTYYRMYLNGAILKRHKDRPSCEISATVCLDWDDSNCEERKPWSIWIKNHEGEKAIDLEPGDAMIYKGCEIEHWREPYHGIACAQVFYHYTDVNGERFNPWDGRPHGGIPHGFQRPKEENKND